MGIHLSKKTLIQMAIVDGVLPKYLYRYRAYSDYLIDELTNSYIWFTKAKDLNDPFECKFSLDTNWSDFDLINYIHTVGKDRGESEQKREILLDEYRNDRELLLKNNREAIEKLVDNYGFCSFTENPNNIPMWSYYTNGHKGVCLKIDLEKIADINIYPMKVHYSDTDELPLLNYVRNFHNDDELVKAIFRTKSKVWQHEDEVRLLSQNHKGRVAIEKEGLAEVIFGFNLGSSERRKIIKVLNENYNQSPIFKEAILSKNKYELEFKSYND